MDRLKRKTSEGVNEYHIIGIMSGSSLDGLDVSLTKFNHTTHWQFEIIQAVTIPIPDHLKTQLRSSTNLGAREISLLDLQYGEWIGEELTKWISRFSMTPDLIGIHGHTVFHLPKEHLSLQIGNGLTIAQKTGIPTVDNFRSLDVLLGGQGAPLVPFGEQMLFSGCAAYLNLGGICNISIHKENKVTAWDIAPCNQVFNHFSKQLGFNYDDKGSLSRKGSIDHIWLNYLQSLSYFQQEPPKSLANQWTQEVLKKSPDNPFDALASYVDFLSEQIAFEVTGAINGGTMMITGGGAYHQYLIEQIEEKIGPGFKIIVPDNLIIEQKESVIFAFLALMRLRGEINVLSSVTGAKRDSCSGTLHLPG